MNTFLLKQFNSLKNDQKQDTISLEVDKLLDLTAATEESLANLPSDGLEQMLSSLQVSIYEKIDF